MTLGSKVDGFQICVDVALKRGRRRKGEELPGDMADLITSPLAHEQQVCV
jgi:hypothetical protein